MNEILHSSEFVSFPVQQAFNATAVVRHMRRLQLGTSHEGPSPTLTSPCRAHMLMPEEDAGSYLFTSYTHCHNGSLIISFGCLPHPHYLYMCTLTIEHTRLGPKCMTREQLAGDLFSFSDHHLSHLFFALSSHTVVSLCSPCVFSYCD